MTKVNSLEQKKDAIWAKWEKDSGLFLSQMFRDTVENKLGSVDDDTWLADLDTAIPDYVDVLKAYSGPINVASHGTKAEPKKKYRKPFERRFHLAKFVTECAARSGSTRFNWLLIAAEWNEAYPFERINPEILRVEYYRAIHDDDLLTQLIMTKMLEGIEEVMVAYQFALEGNMDKEVPLPHPPPEYQSFFDILHLKRSDFVVFISSRISETSEFKAGLEAIRGKIYKLLDERHPPFLDYAAKHAKGRLFFFGAGRPDAGEIFNEQRRRDNEELFEEIRLGYATKDIFDRFTITKKEFAAFMKSPAMKEAWKKGAAKRRENHERPHRKEGQE